MLGKELVIVGACISHMEVVYFNYKDFPDMSIRDALRISMRYNFYLFVCLDVCC